MSGRPARAWGLRSVLVERAGNLTGKALIASGGGVHVHRQRPHSMAVRHSWRCRAAPRVVVLTQGRVIAVERRAPGKAGIDLPSRRGQIVLLNDRTDGGRARQRED